jgi:Rhodopirellula transposase DDE domain
MQPGHELSHQAVARFLPATGYDLQVDRKTRDGASHPDRDAQFESIAGRVRSFQRRGQPVVSVDAKKKESVGDRKDAGRGWQPEGSPDEVRCKDFKEKAPGKVARYGVYDQTADEGRVRAGIDQETAEFGTETLRRWWSPMGIRVDPRATDLSVTSDAGGSNSSRSRSWEVALQGLADELRLRITVCHLPPGTSEWDEIEHRMSCQITEDWRGRPLVSRAVVVNLIGKTRTKTGLRIDAELDTNT